MSSSWRITTNFIDATERADTSVQIYGATAIVAPKGPKDWIFFEKGSTQQILNTFGYPSVDYPTIQDAIDFNLKTGMFISAPYKAGKYGGVFVTKEGTIPFVSGFTTKSITDYSAIDCVYNAFITDGQNGNYTGTLPNIKYYNANSIGILINGVEESLTPETNTGDPNVFKYVCDSGVILLNILTGEIYFSFTVIPAKGTSVDFTYTINLENLIYFILFERDQKKADLKVQITADEDNAGFFYIHVYRYNPIEKVYLELPESPYYFSLDPLGKDGFGNNVYVGNVFNPDNQLLFEPVMVDETFTTFVNDTAPVMVSGGNRGESITGVDLASVYEDLKDKNKYPVKIVFDGTAKPEVATKFENLRQSELKRVRFMLCTTNSPATSILASPNSFANETSDRGIYYYCLNWGIHKDIFMGKNFLCSNMGLIAGKMADVLIYGPGGNPAWIDENGKGGQLGSSIIKFMYGATESQLQALDKARLNPVVYDKSYGPIIKSWRTRQTRLSDYAYIPQSSLADWIVDRIETEVLPLQLGKEIDDFHMTVVKNKSEQILQSVSQWLEEFYVLCDRSNNTEATRAQQKFILTIGVVFVGYTNTIEFNFINTPAGTSVEEVIKKR